MALAAFLLFGVFIILFGLGFVILTLRHHRQVEHARKEAALLARSEALAAERLP